MTSFELTVIAFAIVTAATVTLDLVARRRRDWPVIDDVFAALAATRFLVMLGWWWLGWHFFVR